MPAKVMVLRLWDPKPEDATVVSTISKSMGWQRGLSPFVLGPCKLYGKFVSKNMENGWQYAKVYKEFLDDKGRVGSKYYDWAKAGWDNSRAVRYPVGKGRKPEFSWWKGETLDYVTARKTIYVPLYRDAVCKTESYKTLERLYKKEKLLVLLDYDAHDHRKLGLSLSDVLNNPDKKMGHAFVLMMLLTGDRALKECD